eukprot:UN24501
MRALVQASETFADLNTLTLLPSNNEQTFLADLCARCEDPAFHLKVCQRRLELERSDAGKSKILLRMATIYRYTEPEKGIEICCKMMNMLEKPGRSEQAMDLRASACFIRGLCHHELR